MNAPERIWVDLEVNSNGPMTAYRHIGSWPGARHEYILATPEALAASPEVRKLIEAERARHVAVYAERDQLQHERNRQHLTQLQAVTRAVEAEREAIIEMLLAYRGPVDVPRTDKAIVADEAIDGAIEAIRNRKETT